MGQFSLYITDDLLARIRDHTAKNAQSVSNFISQAVREKLDRDRPRYAVVGQAGIAWTAPLPAIEAVRTQLAARDLHPGLVIYYLPAIGDWTQIVPGSPIPEGSSLSI